VNWQPRASEGRLDSIEKKVIAPRDISEFGETDESDDDDYLIRSLCNMALPSIL